MAILVALCSNRKHQLQLGHNCPIQPISACFLYFYKKENKCICRQPNYRHLSVEQVERYPTMHYFGIHMHTKPMIPHISGDFDPRLHYRNVVTLLARGAIDMF